METNNGRGTIQAPFGTLKMIKEKVACKTIQKIKDY